jgi:hypothetical protein
MTYCEWQLIDGHLHCSNGCNQLDLPIAKKIVYTEENRRRWPKRKCRKHPDIKPAAEKLEIEPVWIPAMASRLAKWTKKGMPDWDAAEVDKVFHSGCVHAPTGIWCK